MAKLVNKLNPLSIKNLNVPGRYSDGGNLYLQVSSPDAKSWLFMYALHKGRRQQMGLGSLITVSLAQAREQATAYRQLLQQGINPLEHKKQHKVSIQAKLDNRKTFKECAEQYIKDNRSGWKNKKHAAQWASTLENYAYPVIGKVLVSDIDTPLVLKILRPI